MRIAEIDALLMIACEAYAEAIDAGDLDGADLMYARLDDLLDQRIKHLAEKHEARKPLASA